MKVLGELLRRFGLADATDSRPGDSPVSRGDDRLFWLRPGPADRAVAAPDSARLASARYSTGLYDTAVTVDCRTGHVELWAWDLTGEGRAAAQRRCRAWRKALDRAFRSPRRARPTRHWDRPQSSFDRETYLATGARSGIHRGRRRFPGEPVAAVHGPGTSSRSTFTCGSRRRARPRSRRSSTGATWRSCRPVRSGFTRRGATCSSPGRSRERGRGARPRGGRPARRRAADSPKDRAELTMIVDLERNDLGRVCATARSSSATRFGRIVRPGAPPGRHGRRAAPARGRPRRRDSGPLSRRIDHRPPKIRAMEIIDELEPNRRSLYTGAIGYFSRGGSSASTSRSAPSWSRATAPAFRSAGDRGRLRSRG